MPRVAKYADEPVIESSLLYDASKQFDNEMLRNASQVKKPVRMSGKSVESKAAQCRDGLFRLQRVSICPRQEREAGGAGSSHFLGQKALADCRISASLTGSCNGQAAATGDKCSRSQALQKIFDDKVGRRALYSAALSS
mmetsp:Transcript_17249/g.33678  ORF Transcript_17249/g.33678 Transcript_17249/m.33678 type:complete len:139 (-) Transcript_17249:225-641(-)